MWDICIYIYIYVFVTLEKERWQKAHTFSIIYVYMSEVFAILEFSQSVMESNVIVSKILLYQIVFVHL